MNQILHRTTGDVIAESECLSLKGLAQQNRNGLQFASFNRISMYADLAGAFRYVDLSGMDFSGVDLQGVDFSYCDLTGSNFAGSNLHRAGFRKAIVRECDFDGCDLSRAGCVQADFSRSNLSHANLNRTCLRLCDLTDTELCGADLRHTDLSDAVGILTTAEWIRQQFEVDDLGVIVYRRVGTGGGAACNEPSKRWVIEPGSFLTDVPNPALGHGCGVAFGTYDLCREILPFADLWRCRIRWLDLADVRRPNLTPRQNQFRDAEGRCAQLELLEIVQRGVPERF